MSWHRITSMDYSSARGLRKVKRPGLPPVSRMPMSGFAGTTGYSRSTEWVSNGLY